jgi:hypothetical protein
MDVRLSDCSCDGQCKGATSCACVHTIDDDGCNCDCFGPAARVHRVRRLRRKLSPTTRVNVSARRVTLVAFAKMLSRVSTAVLGIPVAYADKTLTFRLKNTTIRGAAKRAQLAGSPLNAVCQKRYVSTAALAAFGAARRRLSWILKSLLPWKLDQHNVGVLLDAVEEDGFSVR